MAILIIEQHGKCHAGTLSGRVLIGRWPDNSIAIDDKSVSRIHAWVGMQDGRYYVADAGSRTGTFVNGQALQERHVLHDGDQIRIGPATLCYRANSWPAEATEIDLTPRTPAELSGKQGVFMDCVCGAPLWLPGNFVGAGQCRYCGHIVTHGVSPVQAGLEATGQVHGPPLQLNDGVWSEPIAQVPEMKPPVSDDDDFEAVMNEAFTRKREAAPDAGRALPPTPAPRPTSSRPGPVVPPAPASKGTIPRANAAIRPAASGAKIAPADPPFIAPPRRDAELERVCGICHAPITLFDEVNACPSCGLSFHADCWHENHGCSAYGCPQVGAVDEHG